MKIKYSFKTLIFLLTVLFFFSCKKTSNAAPELTVSQSEITFTPEGGTQDLSLVSNTDWSVSNPASSWLKLSATAGSSGSVVIHLTTLSENSTGSIRSEFLVINFPNGQAKRVKVSQNATIYPTYNTSPQPPDATGMSSNAAQLAAKITLGWNIGNTFEAPAEKQAGVALLLQRIT
jgi:endoglucanase